MPVSRYIDGNTVYKYCLYSLGTRKKFRREGGKPKKAPHAHGEKVAKTSPHEEKGPPQGKKRCFFRGGARPTLPPNWRSCLYFLNNHLIIFS